MRVLAIDLDPQASLSISLGLGPMQLKQLEEANQTIYFALVKWALRGVAAMGKSWLGRGRAGLFLGNIFFKNFLKHS